MQEGRRSASELDPAGALSWTDLRALASGGLVSIQSHGRTHTWYPTSGRILDFCHPGTALSQARWYLLGIFKGEPHPYHVSPEHKFNPLQHITYMTPM